MSRTRSAGRLAVTLAIGVLASVLAGCGAGPAGSPTPTPDPDAVPVVATTSVFADLVAQVGGTRVDVRSLVPKGGEVHTFDPTPADVLHITQARLVVRNGLGLDDWLEALIEDTGAAATVVTLGSDLGGVSYLEGAGGAGTVNPHLWLDVSTAVQYVDRIQAALTAVDPRDASLFAGRADAYRATLVALDGRIRQRISAIPAADRVVVSFHDAFPYFARAYGLTVVGTIVDAPGQDPSAGRLASLVATIRSSGAKAIFAEAQFNDTLVRAVAAETGATVVSTLYDDTLGRAPADTYVGMMTWNTDRVVEALSAP